MGDDKYPVEEFFQRMAEHNAACPRSQGKGWLRAHPIVSYGSRGDLKSELQIEQNKLVAWHITNTLAKDWGKVGERGYRIIVYVGYSRYNKHVKKAQEEKKNGYWDSVMMI